MYHARPSGFFLAKPFSWTSFEVKIRLNKAFRFFNFLQKRRGERLNLDLVANVEPSIEGDLAARALTWTDFDFLHAGLALSDMSRVCLVLLTGLLAVDVIAALMNW